MNTVTRSPRLENSLASTSGSFTGSVQAKHFVKELLKSRIFLGRYIERRLVDEKIGYRDIILVSGAELDLKRDLLDCQQRIQTADPSIHWIGITETETLGIKTPGVCLWTEIDNQPFGAFWFQIKTIKFHHDEVVVILKPLRHLSESYLELEPILTKGTNTVKTTEGNPLAVADITSVTLNEEFTNIVASLKSALTVGNVKEFFTFIFAFIIAIFTGSTTFIGFLGNFILALIREMSILVKNSTPMFLGFLDFISKIVGGFYILIAMFFKPKNQNPLNKRYIQSPQHQPHYYRNYD